MKPTTQSSSSKSPLLYILLAVIAILLAVIAWPDPVIPPPPPPPPPAVAGQSNLQLSLPEQSKPTKVDTSQLIQTYGVGKTYHSIVQFNLTSTGRNKDWGIAANSTVAYVGEVVIDRTIESNDGTTMVLMQEFPAAKTLIATTQIDGIHIDLPPVGMMMLEGLGHATTFVTGVPLKPGWSALTVGSANTVMANPMAQNLITKATQDKDAKIFRYIDSIEQKRMKVTFTNGKGVTDIVPLGSDLSADETNLVRLMNYSSDATILPQGTKPGDTWTLRGADLMTMIDPSMKAVPSGTVTAQRLADQTVGDRTAAMIEIIKGVLDIVDTTSKDVTNATWAPRGTLVFDFKDKIITSAELEGELLIKNRSTNHFIFEASWSQKPKYKFVYHCELRK